MTDYMTNTDLLSKVYNPSVVEEKWYQHWLERDHFHAEVNTDREPYTIVIPPPNVTGSLTIGHVLNNTIQDILIRRARMQGKEACWIPGTDHASIATEVKVEKMLAVQGLTKKEIGREKFLEHAWKWKEEYGSLITEQLKRLGCSCDWVRERFTMDKGYYRAVITAFVRLYEKGLIYRGYRLVNWDPATQSAISDEEVEHREVKGHLWYIRYPIKNSDEFVVVATTRPETMLGDTAVAINPTDKRYTHLRGKVIVLPLVGRELSVIFDDYVDPEFGTGCVKVTPAHDPNDFTMGKKHHLEMMNILNGDGTLNDKVPREFQGLDRFVARGKVITRLKEEDLLERVESYTTNIGYSQRGSVPIEPYLSEQWFMKMSTLAAPALTAVLEGEIKFYPDHWIKTYEHWMSHIQDWCISRQLWWGHRIPVWYCRNGDERVRQPDCRKPIVSIDPPEKCPVCGSGNLIQDPDVLDTWASSWLWPLAVHSWPEDSADLDYFHPTNDLVTGPDIIFFWVARMIMSSLEFKGEIPFRNVYFTGMVRDVQGRKMSKSLGNSPDPLLLMDTYGADAVRFGLMLIAPQGQDIIFSDERIEVGRNFMNKLWNASRFVLMSAHGTDALMLDELSRDRLEIADRWILSRLNRTISHVDRLFAAYRFNDIAKRIYDFTWSDFCDWYVEIIKSRLYAQDDLRKQIAFSVAVYVLKTIVKLLHPFAPFITEELWQKFEAVSPALKEGNDLIVSSWPRLDDIWLDEDAEEELSNIQKLVSGIRTIRSELGVAPASKANVLIRTSDGEAKFIASHQNIIRNLAKVENLVFGTDLDRPPHSATVVVGQMELFIPLEGLIDLDKERQRLSREIEGLQIRLDKVKAKLKNENFVNKAPAMVVEKEKKKLSDMSSILKKLQQNYEMLI
ncbi:MAG: valine--tRNA ligase [Fidelibacterota bacterium]